MAVHQIMVELVADDNKATSVLDNLTEKERKSFEDGNKSIQKRNEQRRQSLRMLAEEYEATKQINKSFEKQLATASTLGDKIVVMANVMEAAYKANGAKGLEDVFAAMEQEAAAAGLSLDEYLKKLKAANMEQEVTAEKTVTARKRLAEMREEMVRMALAGQTNTKEYRALREAAGELQDAIGDVAEEYRTAASDTRTVDTMIRGFQMVTAGAGLATGAMALFGSESEELQKSLVKLNAIMTILSSLQQIQTELRRKDSVATAGQIAMQKAYTVVVGESTGAIKAFRIAAAATVVGAVVMGLIYLIKNWDSLKESITGVTNAQRQNNEVAKKAIDAYVEQKVIVEQLMASSKKQNMSVSEQREYLKKYNETIGKSTGETDNLRKAQENVAKHGQAFIDMIVAQAKAAAYFEEMVAAARKEILLQQENAYQNLSTGDKFSEATKDFKSFVSVVTNTQKFYDQAVSNQKQKAKKDFDTAKAGYEGFMSEVYKIQNKNNFRTQEERDKAKKAAEEAAKKAEELAKQNLEFRKRISDAEFKIIERNQQDKAETLKNWSEDEMNSYAVRIGALQRYLQEQTKLLTMQEANELHAKDVELKAKNITAMEVAAIHAEKKDIENKYYTARLNLNRQFGIDMAKLEDDNARAQINIATEKINARLQTVMKGSREELELSKQLIDEETKLAVFNASKQIGDEKLRAATILRLQAEANRKKQEEERKYYEDRQILIRQYQISEDNILIAINEAKANNPRTSEKKRFELEQMNKKIVLAQINRELEDLDKLYYDKKLINEEEYQKRKNDLVAEGIRQEGEIFNAEMQRQKELRKTVTDAAFQLAGELSGAIADINKARRDAELDSQLKSLETQKNRELDNKNLTDEQKKQIDDKYRLREAQLKRQAAERDKQAAVTQAIINGLLSVSKTFAVYGFTPAAWIAAASAAATAALQVAKIRSTPIPQFAKGTKNAPRGMAWVGEEGPELVELNGGEKIYSYTHSKDIIARDPVVPMPVEKTLMQVDVTGRLSQKDISIDYRKLGAEVGKHVGKELSKMPKTGISIDQDGFSYWEETTSSKRSFKNRRYKA